MFAFVPIRQCEPRATYADRLQTYINFARLMVERDRRIYRDVLMPIEIKGLSAGVIAAKKHIADSRASIAAMHEAGAAFKATADEVTAALKAAESDLRFEAEQLGNGGPPSETSEAQSALPAEQVPSFRDGK